MRTTDSIQLKWRKGYVGLPVAFLRSSLFCINRKAASSWNESEEQPIEGLSNIMIKAKGPRLDQYDRLVYCAMLQICWEHDLPNSFGCEQKYSKEACFSFRLGRALKLLTHSAGKVSSSRAKCFWESIQRLSRVAIYVSQANGTVGRNREYRGPLLELVNVEAEEIGRKTVLTVHIPSKLGTFFGDGRRAELQWDVLRELAHRRDNIASWLYGFYATHTSNFYYPYNEDTLIALMGRKGKETMRNPYAARKRLFRAIDVLNEVLRSFESKSFRSEIRCCRENVQDRRQKFSFVLSISSDLTECSREVIDDDTRRRMGEADKDLSGSGFDLSAGDTDLYFSADADDDESDLEGTVDKPLAF